jgi:signal transduction histidine kinase
MAREIHDTLARAFTGVILQLQAVDRLLGVQPERGRAHLQRALELAEGGLAEARRSAHALRPLALDRQDLGEALAAMADHLSIEQQTRVGFRLAGQPRPLPADVANHLLRIGQEAVTNALRHAQASQVDVELSFEAAAPALQNWRCGRQGGVADSSPRPVGRRRGSARPGRAARGGAVR